MSNETSDNGMACSNRSDHESCVSPTSTRLALALCTLIEHVAQDIVVSVFVHVMDAHVSITSQRPVDTSVMSQSWGEVIYIPLKIVRPWVSVLAFWAEWADIARAVVHQAMADHLVLAFESFAALGARATCDWAVVWSTLTVHIFVGASGGLLAGDDTPGKRRVEHTSVNTVSEMFQPCSLGRRTCTARVS